MAEKAFKYVILGGGVAAVSIFYIDHFKILFYHFLIILYILL